MPGRRSTHHWEVPALLGHHHGDGQQSAMETAFLRLTDWRWSTSAARRTMAGVIGTGLLDDTSLDGLAHLCFWPDRPVFEHPASWLEPSLSTEIVIDLDEQGGLCENLCAFEWRTWPRFASPAILHRRCVGGQRRG